MKIPTGYKLTQAYQAGYITSIIRRSYKGKMPTVSQCMIYFYGLRQVFGEELWMRAKVSKNLNERIRLYETLAYQPFLPREITGSEVEFCLGFSDATRNKPLRKGVNEEIYNYITNKFNPG